MPTLEERAGVHNALLTALGQLEALTPDLLRRHDLPPDVNFDIGISYIEETWRLYRDLVRTSLDRASYSLLSRVSGVANQTLGIFQQMKAFNPPTYGVNARAQRDAILQQLRDSYDNAFEQVMLARSFLTKTTTDFEQLEADAQRTVARLDAVFKEQQEGLGKKVEAAEQALAAVRRLAAETGVSEHSKYFREEANQHRKSAVRWLAATGILALGTVAFGVWSYAYHLGLAQVVPTAALIQLTIAKLIVFSILVTGVVWTGQVYRAHRHNYVVNKHRQNALNTFQAFAQAAEDPQTKSAVLLQAMQSVFAPQETGFSERSPEGASGPQVLEIVREAATNR